MQDAITRYCDLFIRGRLHCRIFLLATIMCCTWSCSAFNHIYINRNLRVEQYTLVSDNFIYLYYPTVVESIYAYSRLSQKLLMALLTLWCQIIYQSILILLIRNFHPALVLKNPFMLTRHRDFKRCKGTRACAAGKTGGWNFIYFYLATVLGIITLFHPV